MKSLTVVFNYEGETPELAKKCLQAFAKNTQSVTAASNQDEMSKLEFFEYLLNQENIYWDDSEYYGWLRYQRGYDV